MKIADLFTDATITIRPRGGDEVVELTSHMRFVDEAVATAVHKAAIDGMTTPPPGVTMEVARDRQTVSLRGTFPASAVYDALGEIGIELPSAPAA